MRLNMQRVNTDDGQFHAGDPSTGTLGTIVTRDFMESVQEELAGIPEAVGMVLDAAGVAAPDNAQVLKAIRRLVQSLVVLADTGAANASTAANNPPLSALPATGYVQCVNVAHAITGASTYAPDGLAAKPIYGLGLQPLQSGELPVGLVILRYLVQAGVKGCNGAWIIVESLGGAPRIPPATQSKHAAQFGQVNTGRLLNVQVFNTSGTYTPTPGMATAIADIVGGGAGTGGGPGTGSGQFSCSAGSSWASYARVLFTAAQIGASQAITVGAGGSAGAAGSCTGGAGGTSSVGSLASGPGGVASSSYGPTAATFALSAPPGLAASPTVTVGPALLFGRGNRGGPAMGGTSGGVLAGSAGQSPIAGGGLGAGATGTAVGASAGAQAGFAGTVGTVIMYEYA